MTQQTPPPPALGAFYDAAHSPHGACSAPPAFGAFDANVEVAGSEKVAPKDFNLSAHIPPK
jgi:hypothetical protein